jgi:hypothetical protein
MSFHFFPSEFIYWTKNKKHDEMKGTITKWIEDNDIEHHDNTDGIRNAHTSYGCGKPTIYDRGDYVHELVYKPFTDMIEKYNSRSGIVPIVIDEIGVANSWYTKYDTQGRFTMHKHEFGEMFYENGKSFKTAFSIIYILKDENPKNSTSFFCPSVERLSFLNNPNQYHYDTSFNPEIGEGSILIFPSSLYHEVVPCDKPGRITISYNLKCSFVPSP